MTCIDIVRLLRISTSGLRRREIHRRSARRPYCPTDELFVSSVTIYEVAPILFLLLFGMIISLIILGIEQFVFYMMHSKRALDIKIEKHKKNNTKDKTSSKDKSTLIFPKIKQSLFHKILMTQR